jgi:hypothetical protein
MSEELPIHLFKIPIVGSTFLPGDAAPKPSGVSGSMLANIVSLTVLVEDAVSYSIQVAWTGNSPVGTLELQYSDGLRDASGNIIYTPDAETVSAISGNTGSYMVNVEKPAYSYVQLVYTFASGTGTMQGVANAKRG